MCNKCEKIRVLLKDILKDCKNLEKKKDLTEYGEGQRDLAIGLLLELKETKKNNYTLNDIKSSTGEGRKAQALLLIANELKFMREENKSYTLQNIVRRIKRKKTAFDKD